MEIGRWFENNRASEEDKYIDLMESLKKTSAVQKFVVTTMMEKMGENRTVKRMLDVLAEKYDLNVSEKTMDVMHKISGEGFKSDESVDRMIDRFEDIVLEVKKIKLAERLEYAMGLQFLERMEKSGKINGMERKMLRDLFEDEDRNPMDGDRLEVMKKEL